MKHTIIGFVALFFVLLASGCGSDDNGGSSPGIPTKLSFVQGPIDSLSDSTISPSIQVEVQDAAGNLIAENDIDITLILENDASGGSATISGTTLQASVNGVATFNDISIDIPQTGYTLRVQASGLQAAVSVPFDIMALKELRMIGIDVLNPSESGTFDEGVAKANECGFEFIAIHVLWDQIEISTLSYIDPGNVLSILDTYCSANNLKLNLTIRPIDLTGKTVPADLSSSRFNSTVMIDRFNSLIDYVFTKVDYTNLTSLQIGNEIDGYDTSGEHADFWSDYGAFLFGIGSYVDANYPGLKVGYTCTLTGVTTGVHETSGVFEALAGVVHVVGVTYYPIKNDFTVYDPSVVFTAFDAITTKFTGKDIYMQEVGYQTSATCSSSEAKQAQFVNNIFRAWDIHKDQIGLMNFVRLHDISIVEAENMAIPYGTTDPKFIEYLRTLGLRTYDGAGSDKHGFDMLKEQATLRGW